MVKRRKKQVRKKPKPSIRVSPILGAAMALADLALLPGGGAFQKITSGDVSGGIDQASALFNQRKFSVLGKVIGGMIVSKASSKAKLPSVNLLVANARL